MTGDTTDKYIRMTETPVQNLVCRLAVPTIISMLVTAVYNMADTYFVGRIDTSASAAVGVVYSLMTVIQACGFFFGQGSGSFIARALGAHDDHDAGRMAATGFFCAMIAGAALGAVGLFRLEPLALLLGSTETILPYAMDYMRWILLGTPFMMASLVLNNQLRFQGSAFYGMIGIASGAIINIGLDPLLIFACRLGIAGAAIATITSQFIGFVLLLIGTSRGGNLRIRLSNFTPTPYFLRAIVRGGIPSLCRQGLGSVGGIFLNRGAAFYGDAAVAAMSIVNRIAMFVYACVIGFGQGFQPVCAFNYGARRYDRVKAAFWFCVKTATAFLFAAALVGFGFAPKLVAFFRRGDAAVAAIGTVALRAQCVTMPLSGWITMCNMEMQVMGKSVRASFLAMARQGLFLIPAVLILPRFLGLFGLQISQATADVITFAAAIPLQISIIREMNAEIPALNRHTGQASHTEPRG